MNRCERLRLSTTFQQVTPSRRAAIVDERFAGVAPSWAATYAGRAIVDAIDATNLSGDPSEQAGRSPRRIVLISDMQSGSRVDELGEFEWPEDVTLDLVRVAPRQTDNAGLQRLADESVEDAAQRDDSGKLRVRITNSAESNAEQFRLEWFGNDGSLDLPNDVYVPAGESLVVKVQPPANASQQAVLHLTGDSHAFDNKLLFVPPVRQELRVLYIGADAPNDPQASRYYLEAALGSDSSRDITIEAVEPDDPLAFEALDQRPILAASTAPLRDAHVQQLRSYLESGGALLYVLSAGDDGASLAELLGNDQLVVEESDVNGYAMLQDNDFTHPMFAPMSGPQYNDFTQIRFWKHRQLNEAHVPNARVVARFENGGLAIVEQRIGSGRLFIFASGWKPSDGQLSRSWKYLLMMSSLVDSLRPNRDFHVDFIVNRPAHIPDGIELAERRVTKPDGSNVLLASDARAFNNSDLPGIYTLHTVDGPAQFAVNVDPVESRTVPLPVEHFEQLGCRLSGQTPTPEQIEAKKQLRDVELERRQNVWKWLVAIALAVLILETWLAGRVSRQTAAEMSPSHA